MNLEDLVDGLKSAYGDALKSVVLYGSAVSGEHIRKRSDYNTLVIASELKLDRLQAANTVANKWAKAGNPPPMTFIESEWKTAGDVFPLEYTDIRARHQVLYGIDPFEEISIEYENLRMQVEREALSKILILRQAAQLIGTDAKKQTELMTGMLSSLMVILRGVLWLHKMTPTQNYGELIRDSAEKVGFDPQAYYEVLHHVRGERKISKDRAPLLLATYIHGMEVVAAYVDGLQPLEE